MTRNIDSKILIPLIKHKRLLWDKHHPNYQNRHYTQKFWEQIAEEMDVPVEDIRKKWGHLRDQFRKELKKMAQGEGESKWVHYPLMLFMTEFTNCPVPMTTNVKLENSQNDAPQDDPLDTPSSVSSPRRQTAANDSDDYDDANEYDEDENDDTYNGVNDKRTTLKATVSRKRPSTATKKPIPKNYYKRPRFSPDNSRDASFVNFVRDPDINFALSLVPHLKEVPSEHKILIQQKLLQVFLDAKE